LALTVEAIATLIAPVLSHLAEDIWKHLPYPVAHKSIFQAGWVQSLEKWHNPELASKWEVLISLTCFLDSPCFINFVATHF
jgi:isoleucyl-tRNA synthetase